MLGWIRIYGHPCAGPAGPARALAGNRKSKKRKENIWIQALKTKTIRTALKFLRHRKIEHPNHPSIRKVSFLHHGLWSLIYLLQVTWDWASSPSPPRGCQSSRSQTGLCCSWTTRDPKTPTDHRLEPSLSVSFQQLGRIDRSSHKEPSSFRLKQT